MNLFNAHFYSNLLGRKLLAILLVSASIAALNAKADGPDFGGRIVTPVAYEYSVHLGQGKRAGDVIYFLHAEDRARDAGSLMHFVEAEWDRTGTPRPTTARISMGERWMLIQSVDRARPEPKGFYHAVKAIERKIAARSNTAVYRRTAFGHLLGGLNALTAGIEQPQAFARIAAVAPALVAVNPFSDMVTHVSFELQNADAQTQVGPWRSLTLTDLLTLKRQYVRDNLEWSKSWPARQLRQRKDHPTQKMAKIFLGMPPDGHLFAPATATLAEVLKDLDCDATLSHPTEGNGVDVPALARWLAMEE